MTLASCAQRLFCCTNATHCVLQLNWLSRGATSHGVSDIKGERAGQN